MKKAFKRVAAVVLTSCVLVSVAGVPVQAKTTRAYELKKAVDEEIQTNFDKAYARRNEVIKATEAEIQENFDKAYERRKAIAEATAAEIAANR